MTTRLKCVLARIPPPVAEAMRELSRKTRVPIAEYQREAFADLLAKYGIDPTPSVAEGDTRGAA